MVAQNHHMQEQSQFHDPKDINFRLSTTNPLRPQIHPDTVPIPKYQLHVVELDLRCNQFHLDDWHLTPSQQIDDLDVTQVSHWHT